MKKILVPIDESPRSLHAIKQVKRSFSPKAFEIILLMVKENTAALPLSEKAETIRKEIDAKLNKMSELFRGYNVTCKADIGKAGSRIIETARDLKVDMIVMTKSSKANMVNTVGTTTSYVIRHAECNVMIAKETDRKHAAQYRGLVYKRAESVVNLRGQLSLKQSECRLPSVSGKCIYHVNVTRGRVRFIHRSYNPESMEWDIPPENGQQEIYDIAQGESIDIPIDVKGKTKKADRIRIINRGMKTEAIFSYKITPDPDKDK